MTLRLDSIAKPIPGLGGTPGKQMNKTSTNQDAFKYFLDQGKKKFEEKWNWKRKKKDGSCANDFERIKTLGTGSFGRVILVRHKDSGQHYAMKVLQKKKIASNHQVQHILHEKRVLDSIEFPFIVNLHYHFKDNSNLYLVLEYVPGGEMFTQLRKIGRFAEPRSRFYAAQILLALEYLHFLEIVYRDLKPENLLIDLQGYIKVTDFGFAKRIKGRTYTFCGTMEYMAPEILVNRGYNKAVDWWALGILIYEMVAGVPPFFGGHRMELVQKICEGNVRYPHSFTSNLKDLLRNLLQVDHTRRFGNLKAGVNDIKEHQWFSAMDFSGIFLKRIKAPYVPKSVEPTDTTYFADFDEEPIRNASVEEFVQEFAEF